jgi:plastocyanin
MMIKRLLTGVGGAGAGALLFAALFLALVPAASPSSNAKPHGVPAPFGSIEFDITEALISATTDVKEAPIPKVNPKTLSDGYGCDCKSGAKSLTVEQDVFLPSAITVHQGDVIALRIFDVEGHHKIYLEDPTGANVFNKFTTYAGNEYLKVFTANQLGIYRLVCETHDPTMKVVITVLRKGA